MEEKKSVDEGEAWAQIGIKATQDKEKEEETTINNDSGSPVKSDAVNLADTNSPKQDGESAIEKDNEGNGLEIDMDAPMDPIQIEAPESSENTSTDKSQTLEELKKKNTIGDGFEVVEEQEKKKESEAEKKRDRSRSRSRDRSRYSESTNSSNPKKVRSRVFVGQINMDKCTKEGLDEAFSKYGPIVCSNIQNGYGFVQFDCEESALLAIKGLNKAELFGREIAVCKAKAWVDLDREDARTETRSQRALMEELEYLRRKDAERTRYPRGYEYDRYRGYDRGYDRSYDRLEQHDRHPAYEMDREGDRYGGGAPQTRGPSYYGEERYDNRYRDSYYGGGASGRSGSGGGAGGGSSGYYMGSSGGGGGGGNSYYGGRRM